MSSAAVIIGALKFNAKLIKLMENEKVIAIQKSFIWVSELGRHLHMLIFKIQ